ncbi:MULTISPECIES: hypothetical protein [Paraburkholderia]|uniref:hypothetical protein n=1 Tax=Paraburkholderia TaxID=1822464 RepID=UPI0004A7E045|nr:hypothetical protein [Paraburkholderia graminis]MDQ0621941.1 hypothetical protein [Paraburkholderia graminis]
MDKHRRIGREHPLFQEIAALTSTVRIMRRARGRKNPEDVEFGSPEWETVSAEFMRDVCKAMGDDPDELKRLDL